MLGFRGGSRNYSIFQRKDGLLFLYSEIDEAVAPFVSTALGADLRGRDYKGFSVDERQTVQDYYMKYARTERSVCPEAGTQNLTLPSRSEIEDRSGVDSSSAPSREAG